MDLVSIVIWTMQLGLCFFLAGFVWMEGKNAMRMRSLRVLLAHRRCAHCGYDLSRSERDPADGATVCPECGCAWNLDESASAGGESSEAQPSLSTRSRLILTAVLSVVAAIVLIVTVLMMGSTPESKARRLKGPRKPWTRLEALRPWPSCMSSSSP